MTVDNSYDGTDHPTDNLTRTNAKANANNALKVYGVGNKKTKGWAPDFSYVVEDQGDLITMTPTAGNQDSGLRYFKWVIKDANGREVVGALNLGAATTPVAINTSTLDGLHDWEITFSAGKTVNGELLSADFVVIVPAAVIITSPDSE